MLFVCFVTSRVTVDNETLFRKLGRIEYDNVEIWEAKRWIQKLLGQADEWGEMDSGLKNAGLTLK